MTRALKTLIHLRVLPFLSPLSVDIARYLSFRTKLVKRKLKNHLELVIYLGTKQTRKDLQTVWSIRSLQM